MLFTIEHRKHDKCFNRESLQLCAQNELISNLMPATGLKIVGRGHVIPSSISSSIQNCLNISGHQSGVSVLKFGPIFAWYRFPTAEEFVIVFYIFFILMMLQMFSIGERSGLLAGQFSTRTPLLRSHAVVIAAVCGFKLSCWNTHLLDWRGAYVAL